MRLRVPRVKQVQSDDGSAVLTYEGLDTSHDLGGGNYRLQIREGGQEVEVQARIRDATYSQAKNAAASEGIDFFALSSREKLDYQEHFADRHGRRSEVVLFEVNKDSDVDLEYLARKLCDLYLEQDSSYKYNHPDYPESGEGYYPDQVYFCPYGVDRKIYMTMRAGEKSDD